VRFVFITKEQRPDTIRAQVHVYQITMRGIEIVDGDESVERM
jgi:hypothetical protein